jgi:hypothetical protein
MTKESLSKEFHWGIGFKTILVVINGLWFAGSYFWASQFDLKFNEFREDIRAEFITQKDADAILAKKVDLSIVEGLTKLHSADTDIHHSRADVVTKDLYQSNRLADRQDVAELKADIRGLDEKLDRMMELILNNN